MLLLIVMEDQNIVQVYIEIWYILQDMLDVPLERLSAIGKPHRHPAELEGAPRRQDGRLVAVGLVDADGVVSLHDIHFAEDF